MKPRLGAVLDVADVNADGWNDLLISSPRLSIKTAFEDSGVVTIVYGPIGS